MGADPSIYIDKSIEALDKADKAFKEFWVAFASIHDDWPFSVTFDNTEFYQHKHNVAQVANYLDLTQSRLLLEKHRAGQRQSS